MNVEPLNQQWGLDDSRISVQYKIPWEKRFSARNLLLGRTTVDTTPTGAQLLRTVPHGWIESPKLYATKITSTKGLGPLADPITYAEAIITVTYEGLPYEVLPDSSVTNSSLSGRTDEALLKRWVELGERSTEGRIIQSFGLGAYFADSPVRPVLNGAPFPYYEETFSLVWHQVPLAIVPWTRISGMLNKINSVAFGAIELCGVYPIRTLMFVGCQPTFTRLPDNNMTRAVNLKYKFKYNRFRWDYLPDPLDAYQWRRVVMKSDPTKTLFQEDDFSKLFRPV